MTRSTIKGPQNGAITFNEDSADVDFRVESNGEANMLFVDGGNDRVYMGRNATDGVGNARLQIEAQDGEAGVSIHRGSASTGGGKIFFSKSRAATAGDDTVVQSGDQLGALLFTGADGTDRESAGAEISVEVDGTPGSNDMPGRIMFATTADGASSVTERMRINSSGAVMIGTTSSPNNAPLLIHCATDDNIRIKQETHAAIQGVNDAANAFVTLKIDGNALLLNSQSRENVNIGCTALPSDSVGGAGFEAAGDDRMILNLSSTTTSNRNVVVFRNPNGAVGTINTSGTTTGFNTSSDYRLKENVVTDWDATSRLKKLKPSRFNFKADKDTTVDGFLAHEVSSIVPVAVSGEKDETQDLGTIKDKDGNVISENVLETQTKKDDGQTWTKTKTEDVYQGIDQSKLVPLLTKSLQEALARIDTLEAEVAKLKG